MEYVGFVGERLTALLLIMITFLGLCAMCFAVIAIAWKARSIIGPGQWDSIEVTSYERCSDTGDDILQIDTDLFIPPTASPRGEGGERNDQG